MRVGLTPTPAIRRREPGSSVAATTNGAAEEKSPGTVSCSGSRRSAGQTSTRPGPRLDTRARRAEHPLGVVARRGGLEHGRRAGRRTVPRGGRTTSPARSRPAARTRCRGAPRRRCAAAARPSVVSTARAHLGQRRRDALHRPRAAATRRRSSSKLPVLPGEQAGQQARERARRCRSRSSPLPQAAQADAAHAHDVAALPHLHAERAHRGDRRLGVGGAAEALDHASRRRRPRRAARRGARSTCRPGRTTPPCTDDAGSILIRRARARPRRRSPAPRAAPRRAPPGPRR